MKYAVYLFEELIETVCDMDRETIEGFYPKAWGYKVVKL
jgi:hypothetical protein